MRDEPLRTSAWKATVKVVSLLGWFLAFGTTRQIRSTLHVHDANNNNNKLQSLSLILSEDYE